MAISTSVSRQQVPASGRLSSQYEILLFLVYAQMIIQLIYTCIYYPLPDESFHRFSRCLLISLSSPPPFFNKDEQTTVFLVAAYDRYHCPYVWVSLSLSLSLVSICGFFSENPVKPNISRLTGAHATEGQIEP